MEPDIARRCLECGAAVRGASQFCPECGKPVKARAATVDSTLAIPEKPAPIKTDDGASVPVVAADQSSNMAETAASVAPAQELSSAGVTGEERPRIVSTTTPLAQEADDRSGQRRTTATRGADEAKVGTRVEKSRQAADAMLEEPSPDPGLRFVLIAVALFILSLLFLLFNHLLR